MHGQDCCVKDEDVYSAVNFDGFGNESLEVAYGGCVAFEGRNAWLRAGGSGWIKVVDLFSECIGSRGVTGIGEDYVYSLSGQLKCGRCPNSFASSCDDGYFALKILCWCRHCW